jgi:hypothetical protein
VASKHPTYAVVTRSPPPDCARYVVANPWLLSSLALVLLFGLMVHALPWSILSAGLALLVGAAAPLLPSLRQRIARRIAGTERARLIGELDTARRADVAELERLVADLIPVSRDHAARLDRLLDGYVRAAVVERQLRMLIESTTRAGGDGELARRRRHETHLLVERAGRTAAQLAHAADLMRLGHQCWLAASLGGEAERLGELAVDEEHELWDAIEGPAELELELLTAGRDG